MNAPFKLLNTALLAILLLSLCLLSISPVAAQIDQTSSKLRTAEIGVEQAFSAVLDAEKAGANVTDILSQLNYADIVLARAENSYRAGYLIQAGIQADSVLPIASHVTIDAQNAKQTAIANVQNASYASIAFTIIGSVIFVLVLFVVWRLFRRRYIKNLSQAKPELLNE